MTAEEKRFDEEVTYVVDHDNDTVTSICMALGIDPDDGGHSSEGAERVKDTLRRLVREKRVKCFYDTSRETIVYVSLKMGYVTEAGK